MAQFARGLRGLAGLALVTWLSGCGGGTSDAPSTDSTNLPGGATTIDVSGKDLFPLNFGDTWLYDKTQEDSTTVGAVSRTVILGPNAAGDAVVRELDGDFTEDTRYRVMPAGLVVLDPMGAQGRLPGLFDAMPTYMEYPAASYTIGAVRQVNKAGSLNIDWDGDGKNDNFSAEVSQVLHGFESATVMGLSTEVAHFTNKTILTLTSSALVDNKTGQLQSVTWIYTEDSYFASGLGLVRAKQTGVNADGRALFPAVTLALRTATIRGVSRATATAGVDRSSVQVLASRNGPDVSPVESVMVSTLDPGGRDLFVLENHTNNGIVSVNPVKVSSTQTRLDIHFASPRSWSIGTFNDTVTINVCYDAACAAAVKHSPITISTSYSITNDQIDEPGVPALKVLSRTGLAHNVLDAEYSKSLNAIIMVSNWPHNALYLFDPLTNNEKKVLLSKSPTAVSVSPNGKEAAVGHDALITWVDLSTLEAQVPTTKTLNLSTNAFDLVLDGYGHVHVMPAADQWVSLHSVDIASNTESLVGWSLRAGSHVKLHPSGDAMYTADNGLSPSDIAKWALTKGVAQYVGDSPYHGDYAMCGNLWMSEDGATIYTACGNTFRSSAAREQDMRYSGALQLEQGTYWTGILTLSQSSLANEIALIEGDMYNCNLSSSSTCYHHLNLYASDFLTRTSRHSLGPIVVAGKGYGQRGVSVFHGADGKGLFLISRVIEMPNPAAEFYISVLR